MNDTVQQILDRRYTVIIYRLIEPGTNATRYVGWTAGTIAARIETHAQNKTSLVGAWIRSLKARRMIPRGVMIERVPDLEKDEAETKWISYYRHLGCALLNVKPGGKRGKHIQPSGSKSPSEYNGPRRISLKEAKLVAREVMRRQREKEAAEKVQTTEKPPKTGP